ncbi:probable protein phosphatase 2C 33 isoform X2 [Mangifera indica]|nr:probable protein phosphatase 2C 33 isoform X2 [Mangifera indica]
MGSCLSADGSSAVSYTAAPSSPSSSSSRKKNNSRKIKRSSSLEMWLHRIPGRIFLNGSTDNASLFTRQGKKGINQDAMIFWENFGAMEDTIFCGVFDGHGPYGHMVSKTVRDSLPLKLSAQWQLNNGSMNMMNNNSSSAVGSIKSGDSFLSVKEPRTLIDNKHNQSQTDIFITLKEAFLKAFKVMDKELKHGPHLDCYCSGTTAVTLVMQGHHLVIGNVGDSRAVLSTRDKDNSRIAVQLTVDQKPNLPKEAERIMLCKGRVFALPNEPEVTRIWQPNVDSPGLAMARSFGDFCLKDYGLISIPEISYLHLTEKDEFIVLATDGVWDVLSNKQVVDIVASAPRSSAARALVESAVQAWRYKHPTSKVDDCAVVCLFFNPSSDSCSTSFFHSEDKMLIS